MCYRVVLDETSGGNSGVVPAGPWNCLLSQPRSGLLRDPVMLGADFLMRPVFAGPNSEVLCGGSFYYPGDVSLDAGSGLPGLDSQVGRKLCFLLVIVQMCVGWIVETDTVFLDPASDPRPPIMGSFLLRSFSVCSWDHGVQSIIEGSRLLRL